MKRLYSVAAVFLLLVPGLASAKNCDWGSFKSTRLWSADVKLDGGSSYDVLRQVIHNYAGDVEGATYSLTSSYLNGVDVFFTSAIADGQGLSASEQTALQNWLDAGGTLVVTADIVGIDEYDSFTAFAGVTGYTTIDHIATGPAVTDVNLTYLVDDVYFYRNVTFSYPANGLLLANDDTGDPFIVVLSPATGYTGGGRILVIGDHTGLTDSRIGNADNYRLARNIADWACDDGPTAVEPLTWGSMKGRFTE